VTYYRIVDNGVGNYSQGQVVDESLLGEVDRLAELGAIAPVDDADVPADAIGPASESAEGEAPTAEAAAEEPAAEETAAEEPAAEPAAEAAAGEDAPSPFA
jgi:hypothetical protein